MDLTEARMLRDQLEKHIRLEIESFEARTGCEVQDLDVLRTRSHNVGHRRRTEINGIRALTELSRTAAPVAPDESGN